MRILIDEEIVDKLSTYDGQKLNISELLMCMIVKMEINPYDVIQTLFDRGVLIQDINNKAKWYVHSRYVNLIQDMLLQSENTISSTNSLTELVIKLQELFPKERKPDANGIPRYSYKGNKRDVTLRLQKFFKLYGQYSYDDVYECTKRYVESFKYDKTYMRILPYYIMKDGESTLANELENMSDEEPVIENPNEDWTNTLL